MSMIVRRSPGYITAFPLTENPISEGGRWSNGLATGLDWKNVQTTPGLAFGTQNGEGAVDDSTAVVLPPFGRAWARAQQAEATVYTTASEGFAEVELRLLTTIGAHSIQGYEIIFSVFNYTQIIKWDGPFNSYSTVANQSTAPLATGNKVRATVTAAGLITAYVDYGSGFVQVAQGIDTTYTSGNPGIGFYRFQGTNASFGLSAFSASDL